MTASADHEYLREPNNVQLGTASDYQHPACAYPEVTYSVTPLPRAQREKTQYPLEFYAPRIPPHPHADSAVNHRHV
jgi:hypothetical protein